MARRDAAERSCGASQRHHCPGKDRGLSKERVDQPVVTGPGEGAWGSDHLRRVHLCCPPRSQPQPHTPWPLFPGAGPDCLPPES